MNVDRVSRPQQPPKMDALVGEGRYAHAAAVLQAELASRIPTSAERLASQAM